LDSGRAKKIPDRQKRFRTGKKDSGQAKKIPDRQKSRRKAGFFAGHLHTQGVRQNGDNIEERGF
jgi:hypothetical protein